MMRLARRASNSAAGRARNESPTRIRSALARARADPRLIAIETPDPPRTGASLTPSPTMATKSPAAVKARTRSSLACGDWRAEKVSMPQCRASRSTAGSESPLCTSAANPAARSSATVRRLSGRAVSARVRTARSPSSEASTMASSSPGAAVRRASAAAHGARRGVGFAISVHEGARADPIAPAVDEARDAAPGDRAHVLGTQPRVGDARESAGNRMLGLHLQCRCDPQALILRRGAQGRAPGDADDPVGERAGLVEHDPGHFGQPLHGVGAGDQDSAPRKRRIRARHGHRGGERKCARAGDHQDRQRGREGARRVDDAPVRAHQRGAGQHARQEAAREGVGRPGDPRPFRLGAREQRHDAGEDAVLAGGAHPHFHGRTQVDRASGDAVARAALDGQRLSGEHGLVDLCTSVRQHPVRGHDLSRAHQQPVSGEQLRHRRRRSPSRRTLRSSDDARRPGASGSRSRSPGCFGAAPPSPRSARRSERR